MQKFFQAALLGAAFLYAQCVWSCIVQDDVGKQITLSHPAKRIVVLAPDLVEDIFAIGAGDRIVGVIEGSDYPEQAKKINRVGTYAGADLERIVELKPDLILAWKYSFPRQIHALRELGFPVFVTAPKHITDVPAILNKLGCLTGKTQQSRYAALAYTKSMHALELKYQQRKKLKVFYLVDANALITINHSSWINQAIELCGGKNIFADAKVIAPEVSRESILVRNPDVILFNTVSDAWKKSWQAWPQISAVQKKHLYAVRPDVIARAGPRLVEGVRQICQYLDRSRTG